MTYFSSIRHNGWPPEKDETYRFKTEGPQNPKVTSFIDSDSHIPECVFDQYIHKADKFSIGENGKLVISVLLYFSHLSFEFALYSAF